MKFFFPDAHDLVDPSFDFKTEQRTMAGSRQQAHLYAHEVLNRTPYDGMLISKAMIDGHSKSVRYSFAQVQRFKRFGAREFLRLDTTAFRKKVEIMGDCGSFSYVNEAEPPFDTDAVIDFYVDGRFDFGISLDHVILGFRKDSNKSDVPEEWGKRFNFTLAKAEEFLRQHKKSKLSFVPIGAAQGWNPLTYRNAVRDLQKMGYRYIALGGMIPLKTSDIISCLAEIQTIRKPTTKLHLLGISRLENLKIFESFGVTSFDSTSPLKQAFMDDKHNYYTPKRTYTAVRIPQVGENAKLKRIILSGQIDYTEARNLEKACFEGVLAYERGGLSLNEMIGRLKRYETLWHGSKDDSERYRETLTDRPWLTCPCTICRDLGIHVIIFRGAERNRRRGFHNLYVLHKKLQQNKESLI